MLRDTPKSTPQTLDCAYAAIRGGTTRLATACPLARSLAVRPDVAVGAVRALSSKRYGFIDLTPFMCANTSCYPIVGGTVVNGDQFGHLNMTFMRTMAPYLQRAIRTLEATW